MRPSGMRWTWPSQRSLRCLSSVNMLGRPARDRTSLLVTLSCHDIPRMWRRLLMWKVFRRISCLAYVVHVSLPYSSVLMTQALYTAILVFVVNLGLIHTRVVRRARVVAAFPIPLSSSASRERLSVIVEPRYVNWCTASSSYSSIVMIGGDSVPCPRTLVFFRLMVSPKSLQAWEKPSISDWSPRWVWDATAASSANSMSLISASRTLVLALRRARLNSLLSDLVHR